jgi:hypothetical protein
MQEEGGVHKVALKGNDVAVNKQVGLCVKATHTQRTVFLSLYDVW